MQLFLARGSDRTLVWIGTAPGREGAKIKAQRAFGSFGGNPDGYEVTPLTEENAIVHVEVTLPGTKEGRWRDG